MKEECRMHLERLSEYLDGELDETVCAEIERHFRECPECRACAESLRKTVQLCRETAVKIIPPDARQRLRVMLRGCLDRDRLVS